MSAPLTDAQRDALVRTLTAQVESSEAIARRAVNELQAARTAARELLAQLGVALDELARLRVADAERREQDRRRA